MISIKGLTKSFGSNQVLRELDVDFKRNAITAVLGPNSSGKTTLMKSILGMVIFDQGSIDIDGEDVIGSCRYRSKIGYLPQIARFPENLKVCELFKMIKDLRQAETNSDELVEYFELEPFLHAKLGHLSGGTRQKVNIVQAFMFDTPYLLLDEPTVGLDPLSLIRLKDKIWEEKRKGKTILITSHIMSFVEEMADQVIFILDGKIQFQEHPNHLKQLYGVNSLERAIASILDGTSLPANALNGQAAKETITGNHITN